MPRWIEKNNEKYKMELLGFNTKLEKIHWTKIEKNSNIKGKRQKHWTEKHIKYLKNNSIKKLEDFE